MTTNEIHENVLNVQTMCWIHFHTHQRLMTTHLYRSSKSKIVHYFRTNVLLSNIYPSFTSIFSPFYTASPVTSMKDAIFYSYPIYPYSFLCLLFTYCHIPVCWCTSRGHRYSMCFKVFLFQVSSIKMASRWIGRYLRNQCQVIFLSISLQHST